ncbi:hypothetical protein PHMEG_0004752 [Phytophthora megakarya]|uniref:Uncharacterized protein n=1 Tax=Phytophthora megakarya TaxID=4795 RepID=A0A225WT86_9STRA|nr:hypothetical protein PHMEG_0004752 [Phytophthora megakarya]
MCTDRIGDPNTQLEQLTQYPGLSTDEYGPTQEILELAESHLRLFFYFMSPRLWRRYATESNRYYHQHLNERHKNLAATNVQEIMYFYGKRSNTKVEPHEILHCMGLLVT